MDPAGNKNSTDNVKISLGLEPSPPPDDLQNNPLPPSSPSPNLDIPTTNTSSPPENQTPTQNPSPPVQTPAAPPPLPPIPMTEPPQQTFISSPDKIPHTPPPFQPPPPDIPNLTVGVNHSHRFPFMVVTGILIIVIAGSFASFLFFKNNNKNLTQKTSIQITPPVTIKPSHQTVTPTLVADVNPFLSPTPSYENPFVVPTTAYENPFGTYENPFAAATLSAEIANQPYENPFKELE